MSEREYATVGVSLRHFDWLFGRETGRSSCAVWRHMLYIPQPDGGWAEYPHDPADLGRCVRLLDCFPTWRSRMFEMAEYGAAWAALATHWSELEALYAEETGGKGDRWSAPRCYARMRELIDAAERRDDASRGVLRVHLDPANPSNLGGA